MLVSLFLDSILLLPDIWFLVYHKESTAQGFEPDNDFLGVNRGFPGWPANLLTLPTVRALPDHRSLEMDHPGGLIHGDHVMATAWALGSSSSRHGEPPSGEDGKATLPLMA